MLVDALEYCREAFHLGFFWVRKHRRQWSVCLQMIALRVVGHPAPITIPDVFAPAKNLTNKTFGAIDWNEPFFKSICCCVENLVGQEQAVVEIGREQ